ncbi:uncharacterized protein LOC144115113 isoform X2 [Amblyomma americanum]
MRPIFIIGRRDGQPRLGKEGSLPHGGKGTATGAAPRRLCGILWDRTASSGSGQRRERLLPHALIIFRDRRTGIRCALPLYFRFQAAKRAQQTCALVDFPSKCSGFGFAPRMWHARENPAAIVGACKCSPPILPKSCPCPSRVSSPCWFWSFGVLHLPGSSAVCTWLTLPGFAPARRT